MTGDVNTRKNELRKHALASRKQLPAFEPAWPELVPLLNGLEADKYILVYLPAALEPDPLGVRRFARNQLAVTRTPPRNQTLTLHPFDESTPLEKHRFGFMQPTAHARELAPADIGLVLVPGLAFDRQGGRLGHGAGYYDRLLTRLLPAVPLVGLVHSELVLDSVPMLTHDVRMTYLLTGHELISCGPENHSKPTV